MWLSFCLIPTRIMSETYVAFQNPVYVMVKPAGASCNLACDYCYYLEKKNLYAESKRHLITDELLEKFTKEYIELQTSAAEICGKQAY